MTSIEQDWAIECRVAAAESATQAAPTLERAGRVLGEHTWQGSVAPVRTA